MSTCVVTGGAGFLGSHLCEALLDVPHSVVEELNGVMVAEWGCHDRHFGTASWPAELADELTERHGKHFGRMRPPGFDQFAPCDYAHRIGQRRTDEETIAFYDAVHDGVEQKRNASLELLLGFALLVCLLFAAPARGAERVTIFDPGEPIWHAESVAPTLDRLRALGTDVVRLRVAYAEEPDLEPLDRAVGGAFERGMDVMIVPVGPAPSVAAYAGFVGDLGRRYPQVRRWAIFNEPDLPSWFPLPSASPAPPPPPGVLVPGAVTTSAPPVPSKQLPTPEYTLGRAYRETFLATQGALVAAGHGPREALIGETSPCANSDFVRGALHGRGLIAGGWAHHPYIAADRPWDTAPCFGPADLPRLHELLVEAARAGETKGVLPIYVTEFGVGDSESPTMLAASEWVMARPYVRSFAQYTLSDDWFGTGLLRRDGAPKPSLSVFANPIFVRRFGERVKVWGHLRTLPHRTFVGVFNRGRLSHRVPVAAGVGGYFNVSDAWSPGRRWALPGGLRTRAYRVQALGSRPPLRTELRP